MVNKSDIELVNEFKNGNVSAFDEIVRRYQKKVYLLARRILTNHDDADDVAQEVFIKLFNSLHEFKGESSLFTWIYRITVNECNSVLRKKKIKEVVPIDELVNFLGLNQTPEHELFKKEESNLIERAIEKLPAKQRTVFVMRFFEELDYEEISKILKKPIGTLKANYFHAVKKIQRFIKDEMQ
ncbi:RNA polymerase sigma-70 factor, ECF subfamily [Candidatus Kryptonium thompsonii]|uniref:RNA polymerase sigma-70 factor, ECF subfamily n=1 Tax=Candidatus Kryptonium thompsonii TaxID=1633631 RepID=A0A0N7MQW2_9BACT|nr:sigma-70 family RNA polymerase sigma factor [Candidatus Kryptonium thompsoni]CUS77505.1 RNA polymerase sigma-70 factor, ECF subfamily [Candidatus Kryptonium thompsoni]CUS79734.1 RNA polymerase sigma-70 factor, ECF subfamily [Candidatus Kryptonium thompsoni]CUS80992.1 RNA polymerase sigma-70 factor, ECF subfamily [Candidatus Kryptonium thompsoni]CUS82955.1 RNA polymerase sigma-70 factor, ECF subfamily [Candidatus Kryptonium thompsoni]CUS84591.1 RNA polymerase sigma-70 factor, ECF subfamily [